jgi:acyl-coenzyme A synthetase/AMP-(fatty) acid ligase
MIKLSEIATIASARAERPAIISADYTLSWAALEASVSNLIAALRSKFNTDHIKQAVFVSDNRTELVMMMAAFSSLGIPLSGIDYTLPPETIARSMRAIDADLLILASASIGQEAAQTLISTAACPAIDLDNLNPVALPLSTLLLPYDRPWDETDASLAAKRPFRSVLFTSGTSGDPKPVVRTRSADARRFAYFTQRYGFNSLDRFLVTIPLYHVAGSGWARHFMSLGATLYLGPVNQPHMLAKILLKYAITTTVTTPVNLAGMTAALVANGDEQKHKLRFVLVGGKNFSPVQKRYMIETLGPVVYEYYGSTETGVNTIAEPQDLLQYPQSVGKAYNGNKILILDDQGQVAAPGAIGQVAVASYLIMDHYADGHANAVVINGERLLITPDRGQCDQEGRLYVFNRSSGKDGDFDVYSVEDQLRHLRGIKDVAIMLETANDNSTERIGDCALVLDANASNKNSFVEIAREVLNAAGILHRSIKVISNIPYNLSGKVRWKELGTLLNANTSDFLQAA